MSISTGAKWSLLALLFGVGCLGGTKATISFGTTGPMDEASPLVWIGEIMLRTDHDLDQPEIYIRCETDRGVIYRQDLPTVTHENTYQTVNQPIGNMQFRGDETSATCTVREEDEGPDDILGTFTVYRQELSREPKLYDNEDAAVTLFYR